MTVDRPRPKDAATACRQVIDARLAQVAQGFGPHAPGLAEAMSGAALAPGKRFRGALLLIAGAATGGVSPALIDAACAVELAHTASLIIDDLPCMDDARTRRGRPTTHAAHGESRAILAGIALVTESLRLLSTAEAPPEQRVRLVEILAGALGPQGLCAGQDMDLHQDKSLDSVAREQDLKTGALFAAGFRMLGLLQGLPTAQTEALEAFGCLLGRVFQSYDDLLDVLGDAGTLGKDVGRDGQAPGPSRGLMAVGGLQEADGHYQQLRAALMGQLDGWPVETADLRDYIAQVLPAAPRAA